MGLERIKELFERVVTGALILTFLALVMGEELFGWSSSFAIFAALIFLVLFFISVSLWWRRGSNGPVTIEDPIFGEVLVFDDRWLCSIEDFLKEPECDSISVSGDGREGPSVMQKATFVDVMDGWPRWVAILDKALDGHKDPAVSARPRDIFYDIVKLDAAEMAWSLEFFIIRDDEDLDMEAKFEGGKIRVKLLDRSPNK